MIGTQQCSYYLFGGKLAYRTERFVKFTLPWRSKLYSINMDEMAYGRRQFAIYWYKPARSALVIRFGWTALFERADAVHSA